MNRRDFSSIVVGGLAASILPRWRLQAQPTTARVNGARLNDHLAQLSQFGRNPQGGVTRHPSSPDWPEYILSTVTFSEVSGKTKVTESWTPHEARDAERKVFEAGRPSMTQGWGGTLDQLEAGRGK